MLSRQRNNQDFVSTNAPYPGVVVGRDVLQQGLQDPCHHLEQLEQLLMVFARACHDGRCGSPKSKGSLLAASTNRKDEIGDLLGAEEMPPHPVSRNKDLPVCTSSLPVMM